MLNRHEIKTAQGEGKLTGYVFTFGNWYPAIIEQVKKRRVVVSYRMKNGTEYTSVTRDVRRATGWQIVKLDRASADLLTTQLTAFGSLREMVEETGATYRPTIPARDAAHLLLADAYDDAQTTRGDYRRAYRAGR